MTDRVLRGRYVELIPFRGIEDWNYFLDLVEMDEGKHATREWMTEEISKYGLFFWSLISGGTRFGVGMCLKVNGQYLMEGLKDKRVLGLSIKHSVESGQLMTEYILGLTDIVYTCAREKDRAIQILCRKIGFSKIGTVGSPFGGIVLFQKEKPCLSLQR